MSSKAWADLHGEDYPVKITHETPKRQPTKEDLQFCFDELLGELGWGDEIEETGIDPLKWARLEIKSLQRRAKSLELRDAANGKCKKCGTLHAEPIIHCDVCGAFQ
jgi:hypothetical protein